MLKQQVYLECVKSDRKYQFPLPDGCPLGELNDVLFQFRSYIAECINQSLKQEATMKQPEVPPPLEQTK
jgi:hypothetical protein